MSAFAERQLGFDPCGDAVSTVDWLSLTGQSVLEVVSGAVFEDQTGKLTRLREVLVRYPDEIRRYVVACDWQRMDQELPLMGRAAERGDELGSRTIAARLVDIAVHLGFMLARSWPPYSKWRGTVFGRLTGCSDIATDLAPVLDARRWQDRQTALSDAVTGLASLQEKSGLPVPKSAVAPFWDRPYIHLDRSLVPVLLESISSPGIQSLPAGVGSVEQQTDNVDVLTRPHRRRALAMTIAHPDILPPTS